MTNKRNDNGMSREEAGQKGGEKTSKNHDKEFYEDMGHKGGKNSSGNVDNDPGHDSQTGKKGGENSRSGGSHHR